MTDDELIGWLENEGTAADGSPSDMPGAAEMRLAARRIREQQAVGISEAMAARFYCLAEGHSHGGNRCEEALCSAAYQVDTAVGEVERLARARDELARAQDELDARIAWLETRLAYVQGCLREEKAKTDLLKRELDRVAGGGTR